MATQAGTHFLIAVVIPVDGHGARVAREPSPLVLLGLPTAGFAAILAAVTWSFLNLNQRRDAPWT